MHVTCRSLSSSTPATPIMCTPSVGVEGWGLLVVVVVMVKKGLMGGGEGLLSIRGLWSSQCGTSNSIKGIIYVPLPITEQHGDS